MESRPFLQKTAARRGARRTRARKGEIDEAICEAAEQLMTERPFAELSVADVLRAAGVSRASFYFYFASKNALLARLCERISADLFSSGRAWFDGDTGAPREELHEAIGGAFGTWSAHGPVMRAVVEAGPAAEEASQMWVQMMGTFVDAATTRIERDRASGAAPADGPNARTLAASLMWMTERALYLAISGGEPAFEDRERAVVTIAEVWWRAIYLPA